MLCSWTGNRAHVLAEPEQALLHVQKAVALNPETRFPGFRKFKEFSPVLWNRKERSRMPATARENPWTRTQERTDAAEWSYQTSARPECRAVARRSTGQEWHLGGNESWRVPWIKISPYEASSGRSVILSSSYFSSPCSRKLDRRSRHRQDRYSSSATRW